MRFFIRSFGYHFVLKKIFCLSVFILFTLSNLSPLFASTKQFYSITAQMKLLVLLPSRISDALAQKNFTRASLLLLVGTHVYQGLRLDTTASDATQVFPFFPGQYRFYCPSCCYVCAQPFDQDDHIVFLSSSISSSSSIPI